MLQIPEEKINFRLTKSFRGGRIRRERIGTAFIFFSRSVMYSSNHRGDPDAHFTRVWTRRNCRLDSQFFGLGSGKNNQTFRPPGRGEKTVAAQSSGATIQGFSEEREKGKTFYEAEMMINGRSKDVLMDARGAIVEVEEQVAMNELPADVQDALRTKAGKGKIVKIESISRRDKLVAYEAEISRNGERSEIQVDPHGKPLFHE